MHLQGVADGLAAWWIDPRNGERHRANAEASDIMSFTAPDEQDWLLLLD